MTMSVIASIGQCTGVEKASIMMLALTEAQVAKLFGLLDHQEVMEISQTMAVLGRVEASVVEQLLVEFGERLVRKWRRRRRLRRDREAVAARARPRPGRGDHAGDPGPGRPDRLGQAGPCQRGRARLLPEERVPADRRGRPRRIEPAHAARVLAHLPDDFATEVVIRMLRMEVVQSEIVADVERTLRTEFMSNLARSNRRDNHELMAEIFNYFDRATEARFIAALEERNKETADRIKALMFTFEDLAKLDPAGIQTLMRSAGNDRIAVALKGASEPLRDLFFKNMSERGAKILRDDMQSMGPVRLRDVEEAQQFLVNMAKELAASGEIVLADGKEDELVY